MNETNTATHFGAPHREPLRYLYDAFNDALDNEQSLKPWADLSDPQRQTIARHVGDMYMWQTESKCDPSDVALRLQQHEDLRDLLV